jgi:hypothetical protein
MPVPDQARDDGSGIQQQRWILAFARMTNERYLIAGTI